MRDLDHFGFKIVDRDKAAIHPILDAVLAAPRPLEIGLYYANPAATDAIRFNIRGSHIPLNTHLDHKHLNIFSVHQQLDGFARQIDKSLSLHAQYAITHVSANPMSPRVEREQDIISHLLSNCEKLEVLCESFDNFHIHIENTFHSLGFYRYLFECISEAGLANIHFCFDLGHAKIWSQETLPEWIQFLLELHAQGFLLHFHLHNNAGINDDHLSFREAQALQLNHADYFTQTLNYLEAIQKLHSLFPHSYKVFEVKPAQALQNLDFVLSHVVDAPDSHPYAGEYDDIAVNA